MKRLMILALTATSLMQVPGLAAPAEVEKATELLAKAWMIDNRCNVLDRDARDELTGFVARAEISLAEKQSVKAARNAIAKGRAAGTAAACDDKTAATVRDVLKAAQSASGTVQTAAAPVEAAKEPEPAISVLPDPVSRREQGTEEVRLDPTPKVNDNKVVATTEPAQPKPKLARSRAKSVQTAIVIKRQKPKIVSTKPKMATIRTASAAGYAGTAEDYYRELRCRRLSQRAVNAMYSKVLREHRRAVAASGKSAVRQLLRNAASRASGRSC